MSNYKSSVIKKRLSEKDNVILVNRKNSTVAKIAQVQK